MQSWAAVKTTTEGTPEKLWTSLQCVPEAKTIRKTVFLVKSSMEGLIKRFKRSTLEKGQDQGQTPLRDLLQLQVLKQGSNLEMIKPRTV